MRRKEKEIRDQADIEAVIEQAQFCRLGLCDGDMPYVVPMCFGYRDEKIYIHSAAEGRKVAVLRKNPNVCVQFDVDSEIVENEKPCSWGVGYRSVMAFGKAVFLSDPDQKAAGLEIIMAQYSGGSFELLPGSVDRTAVVEITVETMTGKASG